MADADEVKDDDSSDRLLILCSAVRLALIYQHHNTYQRRFHVSL